MFRNLVKAIQRSIYTFLNTTLGGILIAILCYLLLQQIMQSIIQQYFVINKANLNDICTTYQNKNHYLCTRRNYHDNIANVDTEYLRSFGPIDVVYTWVNGSDERWLQKKAHWMKINQQLKDFNYSTMINESIVNLHHTISDSSSTIDTRSIARLSNIEDDDNSESDQITNSNSSTSMPSTMEDAKEEEEKKDDTDSSNRYRDNDELRYSIRSIVKNAPWVRRIYLVTDNQIPSWLNMENGGRLIVLSHLDIFHDPSLLPVFSSPAIESQLHHISNISKKFIYFNDDVMLSSPVRPDDFVALDGSQKLYLSWDVPKCAPGCNENWIGDGACDRACNVSSCNFDFPDCIYSSTRPSSSSPSSNTRYIANAHCSTGCPDTWLGDRVCDQRCKVAECAWDAGDCGIDLVMDSFDGIRINAMNSDLVVENQTESNSTMLPSSMPTLKVTLNLTTANLTENLTDLGQIQRISSFPIAMQATNGTLAVHFNISILPCLAATDINHCTSTDIESFEYTEAEADGFEMLQNAVLIVKHHLLVALLYHQQEGAPELPLFPYDIDFRVSGKNKITNIMSQSSFSLRIIESNPIEKSVTSINNDIALNNNSFTIKGYAANCMTTTSSSHLNTSLDLGIYQIKLFENQNFDNSVRLLIQHSPQVNIRSLLQTHDHKIYVSIATSLPNDEVYVHYELLANLIDNNTIVTTFLYASFQLSIPTPFTFHRQVSTWFHTKVEIKVEDKLDVSSKFGGWRRFNSTISSIDHSNHLIGCIVMAYKWGGLNHSSSKLQVDYSQKDIQKNIRLTSHGLDVNVSSEDLHYETRRLQPHDNHWSLNIWNMINSFLFQGFHLKTRLLRGMHQLWSNNNGIGNTNGIGNGNGNSNRNRNNNHQYHHRRLTDTYASSLIHVHRIYNRAFGFEGRKVPAHMPHMIDKDVMGEMQSFFSKEWNETTHHRFRSESDMQYSFSYYYYLVNYYKTIQDLDKQKKYVLKYIHDVIDTNSNNLLDLNELNSLEVIIFAKTPSSSYTLQHNHLDLDNSFKSILSNHEIRLQREANFHVLCDLCLNDNITLYQPESYHQNIKDISININLLMNCSLIIQLLFENIDWIAYHPKVTSQLDDKLVAFEMIGDNITATYLQLNSIRQRKANVKFICVNDNMKHPSNELIKYLHEFYESFYPIPSIFELPLGHSNPTLYLDEYHQLAYIRTSHDNRLGIYWMNHYIISLWLQWEEMLHDTKNFIFIQLGNLMLSQVQDHSYPLNGKQINESNIMLVNVTMIAFALCVMLFFIIICLLGWSLRYQLKNKSN